MELKVNEVQIPEQITWNYEELKTELANKVHDYETMVYSDSEIKEAKADKASLNKLKKALNDERIRREKEYMKPFNVFKTQVNEIIGIIDKPIGIIDKQVKEYEEKCKQEKKAQIIEYFNSLENVPEWLELNRIASSKWLNASTSMKSIQDDINGQIEEINTDLTTLSQLSEFSFEAIECFKITLDLNRAIAEGKRLADIQKRKAEQERLRKEAEERRRIEEEQRKAQEEEKARLEAERKAAEAEQAKQIEEQPKEPAPNFMNPPIIEPEKVEKVEEPTMWLNFSAKLTRDQALLLKEFFETNNIEFKAI